MTAPNIFSWGPVELRWGSAATSTRGSSGHGMVATAPVFLLTDPEIDHFAQNLMARALVNSFTALADSGLELFSEEQVRRVWDDALNHTDRELASVTMLAHDVTLGFPDLSAALLVGISDDAGERWLLHTSGNSVILHFLDGRIRELHGTFVLRDVQPGERFVMLTQSLKKSFSSGRINNVITQLRRAERAAAVLVSQTPPSSNQNQGVIVVDALEAEDMLKLEFPATLDAAALNDYRAAESGCETIGGEDESAGRADRITANWAMRILGIESSVEDYLGTAHMHGGSHGKRSSTPPPEIEDFVFVSYLGSGGFADVYLYEEQTPKRLVAIKVLKKSADELDAEASFRAEIDLMAQLSGHPSIVTIHDANISDTGQPYIVMQFCPLPSLAEQLSQGPLDFEDALRIGIQLAGAVHTAHVLGIVHHDLKPANVLTTEFGRVVLGDFGIAALVHASTNDVAGVSLPWAAPEVLRGESAGLKADVYSLAATIYTAIYGRAPFAIGERISRREYIERVQTETIPFRPIPGVSAEVLTQVKALFKAAMQRDAVARMDTAKELGEGLQEIQRALGYSLTELDVPLV